ncbi:MAG: SDR family NAD(P)-dependent oxidoreductase [Acetobacteraceae bacterium]
MELRGQAALVTGGGSGLGAATCEALAASGAKVAVLDRNEAAAQAVAVRIGGIAVACDVAESASAEAAVATARAAHGPARLLVNCAGIGDAGRIVGRDGPLPLASFEQVVRVNLIGTFNMLRLAAADMVGLDPLDDEERGVIVNTASIAAYEGQIGQAAYAASKAGVVGLTLPAAREFARVGVRVVTIAPGLIETPMFKGVPDELRQGLAASVPFPSRLGRPAEYAALVLHIAANRFLNGETIRLDGALRMAPR